MPLLEREHPLQVLEEHARRAADGHGSLVLVTGEAGIGKTVLLRALAEGRTTVLWGMCDPLVTPRPLGPLRDVAAQLDAAVPALLQSGAAQHEIFAAVLDALRGAPYVLIVEDLHWGDEATLDLVRFLARRIATLPLLLVLSYRDAVAVDHPLRTVLGDLVSSPDARRLQLAPLSRSAVARLVEGHDIDADDVHRRTAGNPFFVSQIVAQPDAPLPDSVRDAVVARITALTPAVRRQLELLSCTPEKADAGLLRALGVAPAAVDALVATGLVDRHAHGVAFRHEIARSAVLGAVTPGSEPALHETMIAALEATGADASALTHHAVAAGDPPRILRYAAAAGAEAARSGSHREAVAFYELALRYPGDDRATRAELLEALSTELYLTDRLSDAIEARTQALALRRELADVVAVGAAHRAISYYHWYAADLAAAQRQDEASHAILDGAGDDRELGYALANRSFLAAQRDDRAEAIGCGTRAQLHRGRAGRRGPARHGRDRHRDLPTRGRGRARPGAADRGWARRPAAGNRRARDGTDEPPRSSGRRAGAAGRGRRGAGRCPAAQRGARHPDLQHVAAGRAGPVAAADGPVGGRRAGCPGRARRREPAAEPAVAPSRARSPRRPARRAAGEPAPGRAVADRAAGRRARQARRRRGCARRERLDHPAARPAAHRRAHPAARRLVGGA